jgi:hypothetical protein
LQFSKYSGLSSVAALLDECAQSLGPRFKRYRTPLDDPLN